MNRSFIASFLGNVVGALLVAGPAVYFYLDDYDADLLRSVENGRNDVRGSSNSSDLKER
jgi:hypothetical protein